MSMISNSFLDYQTAGLQDLKTKLASEVLGSSKKDKKSMKRMGRKGEWEIGDEKTLSNDEAFLYPERTKVATILRTCL